jgi:hypothetical protein
LAAGQDPGNPVALIFSAIGHGVGAIFGMAPTAPATPEAKAAFDALSAAALTDPAKQKVLDDILSQASSFSFLSMAILPALLLVVFGAIWFIDRSRGGYKPAKIDG